MLEGDPWDPVETARQPPDPVAKEAHGSRQQERANHRGVEQDGNGQAEPNWGICRLTNTEKTATMIAAALVIVPALTAMPWATAADESSPRSRASLILVRMKTW